MIIISDITLDLKEERLTNNSATIIQSYYIGRVKYFSFEIEYAGLGYYMSVRLRTNRRGPIPAITNLVRYNEEEGDEIDKDICKLLNYPEIEIFFLPSNVLCVCKIIFIPY